MRNILVVTCVILSFNLNGQIIKLDSTHNKLALGLYPNLLFSDIVIDDNPNNRAILFSLETRPYIAYNLYSNIFVGLEFSYEFFYSNYYDKDNFKEFGLSLRYIVPFHIDKKILNRLRLYTGISYCMTNYRMVDDVVNIFEYDSIFIEEDFIISNKIDQQKFYIPIGLKITFWKNVFIDLNWQYVKFNNGTSESGFMCGIGINLFKQE